MAKKPKDQGETQWQELAERLGITPRQLRNVRALPGAPASPDDEAWPVFYEQHGRNLGSQSLRDQKLAEEIALLRIKRAQAEGQTVALADMEAFMRRFSAQLDQLLTMKLETEAPARVQGKEIVDLRREMRAIHDEIREAYNAGLLAWRPETLRP